MLLNNVGTTPESIELLEGIYYIDLFNLETSDPLDLIRISGDNFQWKYDGELDWREPYSGNEYTEYADNIGAGLTVLFNVTEATNFNLRTDDTFEYPNDDTPTNPIIDIEILKAGDYSAIAEDGIGAIDNNILSTDANLGAIDSQTISDSFFHGNINLTQYGVEGSAGLWVTEPGINKININYEDDDGIILFWDGEKLNELSLIDGDNTLLLNAISDEWGFVLLDEVKSSDTNTFTVESIEWIDELNYPSLGDNISLFAYGDINETDLINNTFKIATGTGDRAISTLGSKLGDRSLFEGKGTEGSIIKLSGLDQGVYELDVTLGQGDTTNADSLWVYNGKDMVKAGDVNGVSGVAIEVPYGELSLIALDASTKTGTSEFIVSGLEKTQELPYDLIELSPSDSLGDVVELNNYQCLVGTGTGDRAVSTIGKNLIGSSTFFSSYGTEGSYITLFVSNGVYEFTAYPSSMDSANNDIFYAFNGKDLIPIADNEGNYDNNAIDVIYGEIHFIALDRNTKTGTTDFIVQDLMKVSDLSYSPPVPITLTPTRHRGDIDFFSGETRINNGTGDTATSSLSTELGIDLTQLGTEGSYAAWDLENGIYEITYSLYASENDFDRDNIYYYDGSELILFDSRSNATIQSSATRWISETKTVEVEVINGELTFITLDTVDKSGTTQLRVNKIEKIGEVESEPSEPPEIIHNAQYSPYSNNNTISFSLNSTVINIPEETRTISFDFDGTTAPFSSNTRINYSSVDGAQISLVDSDSILIDLGATITNLDDLVLELTDINEDSIINGDNQTVDITFNTADEDGDTNYSGFTKSEFSDVFTIYPTNYISGASDYSDSQIKFNIALGESDIGIESIKFDFDGDALPILPETILSASSIPTASISNLGEDEVTIALGTAITKPTEIELILDNIDSNSLDNSSDKSVDIRFNSGIDGAVKVNIEDEFNAEYDSALDSNSGTYYLSEPPYPIPANNKDLGNDSLTGLNLGVLKPWESDTDTGTEYNQGYIYGSYHLGASYITETIGGDDVNDYIKFYLEEESYINFYHSNAIAEILDSNNQVVVGSGGAYSGNLQAQLSPGNYAIGFSSESSIPAVFNASIYLSNSDPNYAD